MFAVVAVIALIITVTAGKEGGSGAGQHWTPAQAPSSSMLRVLSCPVAPVTALGFTDPSLVLGVVPHALRRNWLNGDDGVALPG